MKKTLFAVAILLGVSGAASAQNARTARPKKVNATTNNTQATTVQKSEKAHPLVAETLTDEQIRQDKIKAKEASKNAKSSKAASDIKN